MMLAILSFKNVLIYLMLHTLLSSCQCEDEDLYNVLGVSKSATQTEIKKAYKQLAREWHPDKNNEPGAHEKFLKINEAYETLGDKQKRAEYDRFGSTSSMHSHSGPDPFQNFDRFFHHGFDFNFGGNRRSNYDEYRITHRSYELKIVPESKTKPYIIYANSHMCFECRRIEPIWDKVIQDLNTIGMGIGVASRQNDITLFSTLKIHYVPAIIAVLDGRPTFIRGDFGVHAMRDHIRRLFPRNLITKITDSNYKNFINGWHDNRVRVLLFSKREQPTLRFVLMAYAFRHRICAGYVRLGSDDTSEISLMFNIQSSVENILFFNEDTTMPVASLRMRSIARSTMDDLAESHKYLMLPRISCPAVFHELCPPQSRRTEKKYCVILVTRNNAQHGQHRSSFLQFAQNYSTKSQNVRFSYIYEDSQNDFVSAVTKGRGSESGLPALKIVFLWHNMENKIFFDIMDNGWSTDEQKVDVSKQTLTTKLNNLLTKPVKFPHNIDLPKITDEHANSIFVRILLKLLDWWDVLMEYFWSMDPVATFTALFFIGMTFLIMYVGASAENEQINQTKAKQETVKKRFERREFNIHPFNFATYKELVHKAEPGHITIMVLVEEESREKMLSKFAEVVFPYSKSVYIKFAFLLLEEYLPWYKHLLEETLDFQRELDINKKNCVGTVIAINGHRKYYCLYHPTVGPRQRQARDTTEQNGGDFLGMQESDSENEDEHLADIRFHDDIFENLNVWMDRMYEGSLKRLPVQYWPSLTDMHSGACHSKTD